MNQIDYGNYRITAMVKNMGHNRWKLEAKIYHKDLKDTIFHNAGDLEQIPEKQVIANSEEEAIPQCLNWVSWSLTLS